jgi:rod shape determining protein RodA
MNERSIPFRAIFGNLLRPIDPVLLICFALLLVASYALMHSASYNRIDDLLNNVGISVIAMYVTARISPQKLLALALPVYLVGVFLLVGVELFGDISKGARRWLDLGIVRIQPSEIMKIGMPLMLAWYFQQREGALRLFDFIVASVLLAIPSFLILIQPDLGTSLLVLAAGVFVIFFAGLSWKLIIPVVLAGLLAVGALLYFGERWCQPEVDWQVLRTYQKNRVCTLLDPTKDPLGKGFHTIQSAIAIGSGGTFGKGWMAGTQTHLAFLPERHTDFIFAVLSEEFGFVGVMMLLAVYLVMIMRGLQIASQASLLGARLLGGAITLITFTYLFVNVGMVTGILPIVGVPLPFVSYGGTALLTLCLGLGILMSIRFTTLTARTQGRI